MSENSRRPSRGPMGRGRMNGEKAKDFSGAVKKLLRYMSKYKIRLIGMMIFAIVGTVFNIVGPKILGKATTELFNGLMAKVNGTGGIDFDKIGKILLWTLGLYLCSAAFSFVQGFIMTGISNDVSYSLRKDISGKIIATDEDGIVKSEPLDFSVRQKNDVIISPQFFNKKVKSANVEWLSNFELSYFATVNISYDGFNEIKYDLLYEIGRAHV